MAKKIRCDECGSLIGDDKKTAADRVIGLFGGPRRLSDLAGIDLSSVYRWTYSKERGGTEGAIPHGNHGKIMAAAGNAGLKLTRSDLV